MPPLHDPPFRQLMPFQYWRLRRSGVFTRPVLDGTSMSIWPATPVTETPGRSVQEGGSLELGAWDVDILAEA